MGRVRRIEASDPGGEPICLLTPDAARRRHVPVNRLLEEGTLEPLESGYLIRLPAGERTWVLANEFAEEEADCCAALTLEVAEGDDAVVVSATFEVRSSN